jgi:ABC-type dipeptide/oligopeptide/nickel transport system permease component
MTTAEARSGLLESVLRRLLCLGLTIFLAALLGAALVRLAPGFGMDERQLDARLSDASRAAIQRDAGAGSGIFSYFAGYLASLCRGDLGRSVSFGQPVRDLLADRAGLTLHSVVSGLAIGWGLATAAVLALGILGSGALEHAAGGASGALLCLPAAVIAILALYFGAGPAPAIGAILLPRLFRYLRNITAATASRAHVLAARARGCAGAGLQARHIWLPAAPELLALGGVSVNMALGAAIPVEALSDSPGIGQLAWKAALARDLPVLVNITILMAAVTAAANLASDAARAFVRREA